MTHLFAQALWVVRCFSVRADPAEPATPVCAESQNGGYGATAIGNPALDRSIPPTVITWIRRSSLEFMKHSVELCHPSQRQQQPVLCIGGNFFPHTNPLLPLPFVSGFGSLCQIPVEMSATFSGSPRLAFFSDSYVWAVGRVRMISADAFCVSFSVHAVSKLM